MARLVTADFSNNAEPCVLRYTTVENTMLEFKDDAFDAEIISHTYKNGEGVVIFREQLTRIGPKVNTELFDFVRFRKVIHDSSLFKDGKSLESIILPNGISSIGSRSFSKCTSLASIIIPDSVSLIGQMAFYGCTSLTRVKLSSNITRIGNWAFRGCISLPIVDNIRYADTCLVEATDKDAVYYAIQSNTRYIGDEAFGNCKLLKYINIPKSVICIENFAFANCSHLVRTTLENSDDITISHHAFDGCTGELVMNGNVKSLDSKISHFRGVFTNSKFHAATFGSNVSKIADYLFYDCHTLTSITISDNVTSIGLGSFKNCQSLNLITCKAATPPRITKSSFENIEEDTTIVIPKGCESIYTNSFWRELILEMTNDYTNEYDEYDEYDNKYNPLIDDDDYELSYYKNTSEDGCGEGWSCMNCPNFGCPANEQN